MYNLPDPGNPSNQGKDDDDPGELHHLHNPYEEIQGGTKTIIRSKLNDSRSTQKKI
jgi:hypothetical protein